MLGFESLFPCQNEAPQKRCFFSFWQGNRGFSPQRRRRGVRIPRPKIEELALQAQGVGIFAKGEYPYSLPTTNSVVFFLSFVRRIEDSHHSSRSERGSHFASKAMGARSREPRAKIFSRCQATLSRISENTPIPHPNFPQSLAISPVLCYTNHRKAVAT